MKIAVVLVIWFIAAIALGASGVLERARPPAPQLLIAALAIALLLASRISVTVRDWLKKIDLRALVALHVTRFVGFYFLVLCRRGELGCDFAIPAAWGDVVVATLAMILLLSWKFTSTRRAWVGVWNVIGLLDILFVVASAARHGIADSSSMAALLRLPLSLLPTFLVPLIIATHLFIFGRLARR